MTWDNYFIEMAELIASKSKDPSTQVGCVIVGPDNEIRSTGFNGFPRGVREVSLMDHGVKHGVKKMERDIRSGNVEYLCQCDKVITQHFNDYVDNKIPKHFNSKEVVLSSRWDRPAKYDWVEHAERNAIYNAARMGTPLKGCRAYLNWEPHPCLDCTKGFIQAGIVEVIGPDRTFTANKDWKFELGRTLMDEAGVKYRQVSGAYEDTA
jgi:dCMP deaminase